MNLEPTPHHRRSIRLRGYDYTQAGAYYITIVTSNRESFFGNVVNGEMLLNEIGTLARDCWLAIPAHHSHTDVDEFVIMPNHVHGVIVIENDPNADAIRRGVQLNAPTFFIPRLPISYSINSRINCSSGRGCQSNSRCALAFVAQKV